MTFSELRKKDVICIGDGRLLGRIADLEIDVSNGQIRAVIVPGGAGIGCFFHGDKGIVTVPFKQIACIGDDVVLVSACDCR